MARFPSSPRDALIVSAFALAIGAACGVPARALAADATDQSAATSVGEVVVTAERRSEDIQRTPLALTAVQAQTLDKSFINDISGLNALVPSLESTKTAGFENIVTIRGIGSETPENDITTVPGVSLFVDGVYMVNTISIEQTLFDVDHIEVLRGPQGALYGQSSTGGAINILSNQPKLDGFGGMMDISAGNYALTRERIALNLPLGDTVALRVSFQKYDHQGFTVDEALPDFREDDAHDTSLKAALLWQPNANFSATITGQWYWARGNGEAQKNINDPEPSPWQIYQDYPSLNDLTTQLYHLNLQYDFSWFSIRSVSGYQGLSSVLQEDSSRSAISLLAAEPGGCPDVYQAPICYDDVAAWTTTVHSYTEEFDILSKPGARLEWIVGGFYLHQSSRQFVAEFEGGDTPNPDVAVLPNIEALRPANLAYGNDSLVSRISDSIFAQATYHILPDLRLTLGGRYNHDSYLDTSLNFSGVNAGGSATGPIIPVVNPASDNVGTWRAELDYDVTPDNMLYASSSRGYKPAGANGKNPQVFGGVVLIPASFLPETNTAFEVGSKNFFFDHTLRFNVAGFYYLYDNMQYIEYSPTPFGSGISNIPAVHIYGFEAEASYQGMNNHLHINGSLALENGSVASPYKTIDSTVATPIEAAPFPSPCAFGGIYYNPACYAQVIAAATNIQGNTPPAMPKVSGSIDASYDIDIPSGTLTPFIQYIYRGSEWARIFNVPGLDSVPAYGVTNLNLTYRPTGSRFSIALAATNVFNVAGINSRYIDPYGTYQTSDQFIPPRQIIATVAYAW
jgi:iron complex outermembrane receptor protein